MMRFFLIFAVLQAFGPMAISDGPQAPAYLRCEYRTDPRGIDILWPRLSWIVESSERGQRQTAYRVLVAGTKEGSAADRGDLWDSGKVNSDETTAVVYAGRPLVSHQRCYWKVKLWDKDGKESAWSKPAAWSMGLLSPNEWTAEWIGCDKLREAALTAWPKEQGKFAAPAICLRNGFRIEKPIHSATLYATALGIMDLHINGKRVTDEYFAPGWSDYSKRVYYRTYDVTELLRQGGNVWNATLADGWYSGHISRVKGKRPRFRGQLRIEYADGTSETIVTDKSWRAAVGATLEAELWMGETYDARREANYSQRVDIGAEMTPKVESHPGPPVRVFEEFAAQKITEPKPGVYVWDFGQNFAGICRLTISGEAGQNIVLRFAERLAPDGTVYTKNLGAAKATDTYICRGEGVEVWQPRFTFHGFQYVEIVGLKRPPAKETLVGLGLSSDTPVVGDFSCSDPMLSRLHKNIYYGQRSNFIDVPTDCPQRSERLGWTGDAQVFVRTATLNTDVQTFFTKWLAAVDDGQRVDGQFPCVAPSNAGADRDGGPAWADAGTICPWTIYEVYGDRRVLEQRYVSMMRYIEFCKNRCTSDLLPPKQFHCFGDWLNIKAESPHDVIYMAYFAHSTKLTAKAAEALGKTKDAARLNTLFEKIKASFNRAYVGPDGRIKGNTQTAYALALTCDLFDGEKQKLAAKYLADDIAARNWHLSTGFIGTKDLLPALSKVGRNDVAYRLLHNDTFPSWGFSIKHGATTIWERWDGWTPEHGFQDPGMNSFNHYSFGAVYQWMVENIGGIRTQGPGYKQIIIAPSIDDKLTWAKVGYRSIRGQIAVEWKNGGGKLTVNVTIPANTTATVRLPTNNPNTITESGLPAAKSPGVTPLGVQDSKACFTIQSGAYSFIFPYSTNSR